MSGSEEDGGRWSLLVVLTVSHCVEACPVELRVEWWEKEGQAQDKSHLDARLLALNLETAARATCAVETAMRLVLSCLRK